MKKHGERDFGLEFLLPFDGRIHIFEDGSWIKFEIKKGKKMTERPHGLSYSFTLHAAEGTRLLGFDNAHSVPAEGSKYKARPAEFDHWHRTEKDAGRPYKFKDAETLLTDFEKEFTRILKSRGIDPTVVSVKEKGKKK
jgi:hypothetical protein